MKLKLIEPPRPFEVGRGERITITDCARIELRPDEQVTFLTETGGEYDVARKSWGFYATPSLNGRLTRFKLRPALVRSPDDKYYVFLLEQGREEAFNRYLKVEDHTVSAWLDEPQTLQAISAATAGRDGSGQPMQGLACPCGSNRFQVVHVYHAAPQVEIAFQATRDRPYLRDLARCQVCGHFVSRHQMHDGSLYSGDYVSSNYADQQGIARTFDKINALPPDKSDNVGRVQRIEQFASSYFPPAKPRPWSVLDVGSGLAVFPYRMRLAGWTCTALDPDERAVQHARQRAEVTAVCADFLTAGSLGQFDTITFNKVLEHVPDPVAMLERSALHLAAGGFVYVELPDGEAAIADGPEREEFTIDHFHVFSLTSLALLATQANFETRVLERLREPSGKYTLRAFLVKGVGGAS